MTGSGCAICGRPVPPGDRPGQPRKLCGRALCAKTLAMTKKRRRTEGIPSHPLVAVITREAAITRGSLHGVHDGNNDAAMEAVLERLGVSPRLLFSWRTGQRPELRFDRADRILLELNLLWFDVWNEQTVRQPVLEIRQYSFTRRRHYLFREIASITRIGDVGPDHATIELVRTLFEGDAAEQAAAAQYPERVAA